ncbi:DUF2750 domain-containing protein [Herbaspirillum sp. SJZ107]|uniref:DUF2750 domain-containing protein n=1 Tax=Herbaspirillum sp. SJZ107 TaxID=2572881 RepID=UPI00115159A2|nr:DUF2750 domain-containing protein [Herbaspirillum sp. SJZ107]TQK04831.1 uncharacterized protein DUF2750 [Herbaspirillum sp. SJZ107]
MQINPRQMAAILALPAPARFKHAIKVIADRLQVWSLYKDGWALVGADDGTRAFPLWPARDYAELCAIDAWAGYEARSIPLDDFMGILLAQFKREGILPAVFVTPASKGVTLTVDALLAALEEELQNY